MTKEIIRPDLSKEYGTSRIAYIILTCEKYKQRQVCQKETFLQNVDYYYISSKMDIENNVYGFNTGDNYVDCPDKYLQFIRNMNLNYDWYIFLDDDSYVFPIKLIDFLSHFDSTQKYYMGVNFSQTPHLTHFSGGAGFILSKPSYDLMKQYLQNEKTIEELQKEHSILYPNSSLIHGDVFIAMCIGEVNKYEPIQYVDTSEYFHAYPNKDPDFLKKIITLHYLKEEDYQFYYTFCSTYKYSP